jgi:hypothetical protein
LPLDDTVVGVVGHSRGKYRFLLQHAYGDVCLTSSESLPMVRVQLRSDFLHGVGAAQAFEWFAERLERWLGPLAWMVSRIDLHSDWQGWSLSESDLSAFICRAADETTHHLNRNWSGFEFGTRRTGTICCRIYNKTLEILQKGGTFWREIWGERYDPDRDVARVEFELHRDILREFGLSSPAEVLASTGGLWAYATQWLTHREPTGDETPARWPISAYWQAIQRASLTNRTDVPLDRIRAIRRAAEYDKIVKGLGGWAVSLGACRGITTADGVASLVPAAFRHWEGLSGKTIEERVRQRVAEWRFG